jgi:hypothetical protein
MTPKATTTTPDPELSMPAEGAAPKDAGDVHAERPQSSQGSEQRPREKKAPTEPPCGEAGAGI